MTTQERPGLIPGKWKDCPNKGRYRVMNGSNNRSCFRYRLLIKFASNGE